MSDWEQKIANPDPRVKWAMDVMDQEGQDFESFWGKVWAPFAAAMMIPAFTASRNVMSRVPIRTNMLWTIIMGMPIAAAGGYGFRKWVDYQHAEEEAVVKHYILTHPERFPEPKRVKYIDHIAPWKPIRW